MNQPIETDVLIVGSGPAGLPSASLLSSYGIRNIMLNRHGWLADTPRAHITNQRTMEVLRDLGVARQRHRHFTEVVVSVRVKTARPGGQPPAGGHRR